MKDRIYSVDRENYARLLRKLNREKTGNDTVPTSLNDQLPLLSAGQRTIYDRKLAQAQQMYLNQPVPEEVRRSLFHQVQLETRRDVMETYFLGDSLDPKRRQRLQAIYKSKPQAFKDKANASVEAGLKEQWGATPVFGQQTRSQLKQVMLDRYLVNSDSNAMEIAYLGQDLDREQTKSAETFFHKKLTPEQQQEFNRQAITEHTFMWGALAPAENVGGRIRWLLRLQKMQQVYGAQVFRGEQKAQPQDSQSKAKGETKTAQPSNLSPVDSFKQKLSQNAQQRLQSNYDRLDSDLKDYRNLSPNNPKWQQLRQLSQQDQQLVGLNQRLNQQIGDLIMKDRRETPYLSPNIMVDRDDQYPNGVVDPKIRAQIQQLEAQQNLIQISRRQMQAQYPALAVIDSATVANSTNAQLLGTITQGFGKIQFNIKDLSQQIQKDPSKALFLDDVVKGTLDGLKIDPNNPDQSATNKAIVDYLKGEQTKDNLIKWGGTLLTGGLTIGAILATMGTGGAALPFALGLGGALTGLGTAAYEYRELAAIDLAANAQQGGTKLTSQDKDTAQFNLMLGRINLIMAVVDVGLSVKAATGLLKLGAKPISQFDEILELQKAGKTEQAVEATQQLKKEVDPQTFEQLEKVRADKQAKLQKLQEKRKTAEAQRKLQDGIKEAEARGKIRDLKQPEREWLTADSSGRRKELAFDPDTKSFKVEEAKAALQAEKDGLLESPLRRAIDERGKSQGGDYIDAKGKYWDVKDASAGADRIAGTAALKQGGHLGENVLVDCSSLPIDAQRTLESEVRSRLTPQSAEVVFVPKR